MNTGSIKPIKKRNPDLGTLISSYRLCNSADGKSPRTIEWYDSMLHAYSKYVKQTFGQNGLENLSRDSVRSYILYLRQRPRFQDHPQTRATDQPLSPKTVQGHVRTLKAFATWLYMEGHTKENVLSALKLPKAPDKIIEPLSKTEIGKLLACIDIKTPVGKRDHAMIVTLLDTGLRASELANIKINDISLENGLIKVMGKGARERIVPIGKFVQMTLLNYVDRVRPVLGQAEVDYLFLSRNSKPLSVNAIKLLFTRLRRSAGIPKLHAHLCRHTFAIHYLMNGGDIFSLKEILGHKSLEMVNHYLHFTSHQIAIQHHKYSPMDRMQEKEGKVESS